MVRKNAPQRPAQEPSDWRYGTGGVALPIFVPDERVIHTGVSDTWKPPALPKVPDLPVPDSRKSGLFTQINLLEKELKKNRNEALEIAQEYCAENSEKNPVVGGAIGLTEHDEPDDVDKTSLKAEYQGLVEYEDGLLDALVKLENDYINSYDTSYKPYSKVYDRIPQNIELCIGNNPDSDASYSSPESEDRAQDDDLSYDSDDPEEGNFLDMATDDVDDDADSQDSNAGKPLETSNTSRSMNLPKPGLLSQLDQTIVDKQGLGGQNRKGISGMPGQGTKFVITNS